jgi:serine protease Do
MSLAPLDEAARRRLNLEGNVVGAYVERVDPNSDAANKGVTRGVVITRANDRPISSPADVQAVIAEARRQNRSAVLFWFRTPQGNTVPLAIRLQPPSANG